MRHLAPLFDTGVSKRICFDATADNGPVESPSQAPPRSAKTNDTLVALIIIEARRDNYLLGLRKIPLQAD
jgi:hypothetical protein